MTFMLLNVETVSAVQERMAKDQTHIAELTTELAEAVHGLENGAWLGSSACQFFREYDGWDAAWKRRMEIMRIFAERMKQEIDEWEEAASALG